MVHNNTPWLTSPTGVCRNAPTQTVQTVVVALADTKRRQRLSQELTDRGFDVTSVATGYHLIEHLAGAILDATDDRPDLIIVGPKLAGCQEMTVLAGLRDLGWDTPILFLIDSSSQRARMKYLRDLGVRVALYEPFNPDRICALALKAMLVGHSLSPWPATPPSDEVPWSAWNKPPRRRLARA